HNAFHAVLRHEFTLLDGAFHEYVVALLERDGYFRHVSVERQAVPVGALMPLLAIVLKAIGLAQPRIGDWHSRGKIPHFRTLGDKPCYLDTVHLHNNGSAPFSR